MGARPIVAVTASILIGCVGAPSAGARSGVNYVKEPVATGTGGAVASTLGVTEPFVAGPGGGGFMVVYLAKTHQIVTIDGREKCPAACTQQLFIDPATGAPLPFEEARHSGLSVGVPGMVATWANAVRDFGVRSFADDLRPAMTVARRGFTITPDFVSQERSSLSDLQAFTPSRELFLTPDGQPLPVGSTLQNPDLANTYAQLARNGPDWLYHG